MLSTAFQPTPREEAEALLKHYSGIIDKMFGGWVPPRDAPEWLQYRFHEQLVRRMQASKLRADSADKWDAIKELFREIGRA